MFDNQKIYNIIDTEGKFEIYAYSSYGPCFGQETDFGLYDECMERNNNWFSNKKTFNFNNDNINGRSYFGVFDYEVYQVFLNKIKIKYNRKILIILFKKN